MSAKDERGCVNNPLTLRNRVKIFPLKRVLGCEDASHPKRDNRRKIGKNAVYLHFGPGCLILDLSRAPLGTRRSSPSPVPCVRCVVLLHFACVSVILPRPSCWDLRRMYSTAARHVAPRHFLSQTLLHPLGTAIVETTTYHNTSHQQQPTYRVAYSPARPLTYSRALPTAQTSSRYSAPPHHTQP